MMIAVVLVVRVGSQATPAAKAQQTREALDFEKSGHILKFVYGYLRICCM